MKKVLLFLLIAFFGQSCSKTIISKVIHKDFINDDDYKLEKFSFINDSTCMYIQEFLCDIDNKYKTTTIICQYNIEKDYIILKAKDSLNLSCFPLPKSEIDKCDYMKRDLDSIASLPLRIDAAPSVTLSEVYGYINGFKYDTLYYNNRIIYYKKAGKIACDPEKSGLFVQTTLFMEEDYKPSKRKVYRLSSRKKNIPVNIIHAP